ncbi:MAG: MauE/DoxX family redox-associated membrane protein [Pseudomonadota bacterium]
MLLATTSIAAAWFLAWLFAIASFHKLRAPQEYAALIQRQLPGLMRSRTLARATATLLGVAELATGVALLLAPTRAVGAALAAGLLLLYGLAMSRMLARGIRATRCGCGGLSSTLSHSWALVGRNVICAALAGLVLLTDTSASLLGGAFALLLVVMYLGVEQLISNAQQMQEAR